MPIEVHKTWNGKFVAKVPQLPEVVGHGDTRDEAFQQARDKAENVLIGMLTDRVPIPPNLKLYEGVMLPPSRILFVDDELDEVAELVQTLRDCGVTVDVAASGVDGLRLAESSQPDLIIADLYMPELTGHDLLDKLNLNPITNDIPVILFHTDWLITPDSDPPPLHMWSKRTASGRTPDMHWTKPINLDEWMLWLGRLLRHFDRHRREGI